MISVNSVDPIALVELYLRGERIGLRLDAVFSWPASWRGGDWVRRRFLGRPVDV
jgi:hypothetical protein